MNRRAFLKAGTTLALAPAILPGAQSPQVIDPAPPRLPAAGADGWVSLLNGRDLSGWYTMLQRSGKGVAEEQRMILMEEEMLHIMGNEEGKFPAEGGYLATNQEFANVRIRVEYKWGMKRHAPRYTPKRDNGLLYTGDTGQGAATENSLDFGNLLDSGDHGAGRARRRRLCARIDQWSPVAPHAGARRNPYRRETEGA